MGTETGIQWANHTFNMWRGCSKVEDDPCCLNCYAEAFSGRNPAVLGIWGPDGNRAMAAESYWRLPFKWNEEAKAAGERRRVFCASLADVFEADETMPESSQIAVHAARVRLLDIIRRTPYLDWLLLTKRPESVMQALEDSLVLLCNTPTATIETGSLGYNAVNQGFTSVWLRRWCEGKPPPNVWIGTSVGNQEWADKRIPELMYIPAAVRFLSIEPLCGPVDLSNVGEFEWGWWRFNALTGECDNRRQAVAHDCKPEKRVLPAINWIIVGGESGSNARPMNPDWARSIRDQCVSAGVPFFFKQWGEYGPTDEMVCTTIGSDTICGLARVGKKTAGRLLDGREWNEVPEVRPGTL